MYQKYYTMALILGLVLVGFAFLGGNVYAQENPGDILEIPFIDRDSDGINDMLQHAWALRILDRIERRQEFQNLSDEEKQALRDQRQNMTEEERQAFREERQAKHEQWLNMTEEERAQLLNEKFNQMVDTDNDGVADTKLGTLLQDRKFRVLDEDGDGMPDRGARPGGRGFRGQGR